VDKDDSTTIRNLYLMFHASEYKVEVFLKKKEAKHRATKTDGVSSKLTG